MSIWYVMRGVSLVFAGLSALCAVFLREKLVSELTLRRQVYRNDFPVHLPLILERAHRFYIPESLTRVRFRSAYLIAVVAGSFAALSTIFIELGF